MSSPIRNLSLERRSPLPNFRASDRWAAHGSKHSETRLTAYQIKEYLARYPNVLEDYLLETVSTDYLNDILAKKRSAPASTVSFLKQKQSIVNVNTLYSETGIEHLSRRILTCSKDEDICAQIYDICQVVGSSVAAHDFRLYASSANGTELSLYKPGYKPKIVGPIGLHLTVSAHVAHEKRSLNVTDLPQDSRFPKGTALGDDNVHQVMAVPIILSTGRCFGVAEFVRGWSLGPFSAAEFELTNAVFCWVNACVQKMKINKVLRMQDALHNFLLESTKVMFNDVYDTERLVTNIILFTKDLVSADRCALFLVDQERSELFADFFDEGKKADDGTPVLTKKPQIRFPTNRGIAGFVAETGNIVNIKDAYKDDRFNPEIDKQTGYHTKNILCMPIRGKRRVVGVVQMINRLNGDYFTDDDEEAFKMFSVYCALSIHYSRVYNILRLEQLKYKVAVEVIQYHIVSAEKDAMALKDNYSLPDDLIPPDFYTFDFCAYGYSEILPQLFIKMLHDTFGERVFDISKLCRFTLTVQKNYRPVAYHNWEHGFHVAHAVWRMIKMSTNLELTALEKMAFIVGAICHDIDHRGYNNEFFKKLEHPLAALYSTSIMECHHYEQTIAILHSDGHDIFSFLSADDHRHLLQLIQNNILATDLSLYFANRKYLQDLINKKEFKIRNREHRNAMFSLMMTGSDLCAVPKPWETQMYTAECIYEEFWFQGDEEKQRGLTPIRMMDRIYRDEVPKQQVGFINFVCLPLYETLSALLPAAKLLVQRCKIVRDNWEDISTEHLKIRRMFN